jgi:hypothetical protein
MYLKVFHNIVIRDPNGLIAHRLRPGAASFVGLIYRLDLEGDPRQIRAAVL